MPEACLDIPTANDFLTENTNVVKRAINKFLALTTPWMDCIESDTWYAGVSATQRSVVQKNVCATDDPNALSYPQWDAWSCKFNPKSISIGTCEYSYSPEYREYQGPTFCVATDHHSFRGSIRNAEEALRQFTYDTWHARNRQQSLILSGTRMLVNSTLSFNQAVTRGFQTNFVAGTCPDGPLTWKALQQLKNFMKNTLTATPDNMWGSSNGMFFKFIGSDAIIDSIRDEAGGTSVGANLQALTTGGYEAGRKGLTSFAWEGPYRGVGFGVDQTPIRLNGCNADGSVDVSNIVPPFVCSPGSTGTDVRAGNPKYEQAPYELGFLLGKKAIYREIPQQFLGEGTTRFDKQYWGGDVQWINNKDSTCNPKGDRGYHLLSFAAAYRPDYPQFIIPILYGRCETDLGVTPCTLQYYTSGDVYVC